MTETHVQGAIHFVANNNLKFEHGPHELFVRHSDVGPMEFPNRSTVAQPTREEVRERMSTEATKLRIADLLSRYPEPQGALLEVLWLVQGEFGWVPREGIRFAAEVCSCSPAHAYGVATFYTMYRHAPAGRFLLQFCRNISCTVKGAPSLISFVEKTLNAKTGETTSDGLFTILQVECLGACGNGPVMLVNDEFATDAEGGELTLKHGTSLTEESILRILDWCRARAKQFPEGEPVRDVLGGMVKGHTGHPGAVGSNAKPQDAFYAPPSPVLNVRAEAAEGGVTLTWKGAPEFTKLTVERLDGKTWTQVGEPSPKDKAFVDAGGKAGAQYRMIAESGPRVAKPSAVATAVEKAVG